MNRRGFVKALAVGGAATAAAPAIITAALIAKPKREPLPLLRNGDVLNADYFADLVNRVNELEAS